MQLITAGSIKSLSEARAAIRRSFPIETYEPVESDLAGWNEAYQRFERLVLASG
jgi:hypothetical protein